MKFNFKHLSLIPLTLFIALGTPVSAITNVKTPVIQAQADDSKLDAAIQLYEQGLAQYKQQQFSQALQTLLYDWFNLQLS
ncbi:MAG: hypothetical protein U7127_16135 [Phormidium sp.]